VSSALSIQPLLVAGVFSGGGSPAADAVAVGIAVITFALLLWAIELIDRI
jgi:hypothetical protein